MSDRGTEARAVTRLSERAAEAAVEALWRQWAMVNPLVRTDVLGARECLVDPEALVLGSLALAECESRLVDLLAWWAEHESFLLSVQRMRTLLDEFSAAGARLGWFAHWAVHRGGDRRWNALAVAPQAAEPQAAEPRLGKGPEVPRMEHRATMMLKLRAGFGVGVKADVLAFLLCLRGEPRTATEIADAIGYTDKSVRIAVRDLGFAGFVEETRGFPARYAAAGAAGSLLVLMYGRRVQALPPRWCYWAQVLSFLLGVAGWKSDAHLTGNSYVASSRARDLFEKYETVFRAIGVRMPRPEMHPGTAYLGPFEEFITELASWMEEG